MTQLFSCAPLRAAVSLALAGLSFAASAQSITHFTLINTDTQQDMATVSGSATVQLPATPHINLRANAPGASKVVFSGAGGTRSENSAPFAFKGDAAGVYATWAPAPGTYTIVATPYGSDGRAGPSKALSLTVQQGAGRPSLEYQYEVILGHDGYADPDDNLASLAGFMVAHDADNKSPRVKLDSMVYGDTQNDKKAGLQPGGPPSGHGQDPQGEANYRFFLTYTQPALRSIVAGFSFFDVVGEVYNFNAKTLAGMTRGGARLAQRVQNAIGSTTRVVYSAGGGTNAAAEAIAYLRNQGYSDPQILNHFAIVQHSVWNWEKATEPMAREITGKFVISLSDQNVDAGQGSAPRTVKSAKTSDAFAKAWAAATGANASGIANLAPTSDASDGGSHSFASNPGLLDAHWRERQAPGVGQPKLSYRGFTTQVMNALMN